MCVQADVRSLSLSLSLSLSIFLSISISLTRSIYLSLSLVLFTSLFLSLSFCLGYLSFSLPLHPFPPFLFFLGGGDSSSLGLPFLSLSLPPSLPVALSVFSRSGEAQILTVAGTWCPRRLQHR